MFTRSKGTSIVLFVISVLLYIAFKAGLTTFSELEVWGTLTGLWSVWWAVLNLPANWAIGLVNEALFFALFWQYGLYANAWLQVFFAAVSIYGWVYWLIGGKQKTPAPITRISNASWHQSALTAILATLVLGQIMYTATGVLSWPDTITTVLSIIATYFLAKRKIGNWLIWFAADMIYIPYLASQGLYLTSALYVLFAALCIKGLYDWKQIYKKENQ